MRNLVGCYGVVGRPGAVSAAISFSTRSWANHTFIVIPNDMIVEAWVPFVRIRPLSDYDHIRVEFNNHESATDEQRTQVVRYAESMIGHSYDLVHFAALGLRHLMGINALLHLPTVANSAVICSRLVLQAGAAAGLDWASGLHPAEVTPATLARRLTALPTPQAA